MEITKHKYHSHRDLSALTERKDRQGNPIPFSFIYVSRSGNITHGTDAIVTSVHTDERNRMVRYIDQTGAQQHRRLTDVLFMQVNDIRIS